MSEPGSDVGSTEVMSGALCGVRVVDLSWSIAGAYATKLFADFGADVLAVRPAHSGAATLGRSAALFDHLVAGKRVIRACTDSEIANLVEHADLVVESGWPGVADLRRRCPAVVVLSLRPYGCAGPWADRPGNEFVIQAESGCTARRGRTTGVPMQIGAGLLEWATGTFGAVGALTALIDVRRTGRGEHVDSSMFLASLFSGTGQLDIAYQLAGSPPISDVVRGVQMPSIEPTSDGWVGFVVHTRQQFDDFVAMIGRPELADGEAWANAHYREARAAEWQAMVHAWTTVHTTAEILEIAPLRRIPVAPVNNAADVHAERHFRFRHLFDRDEAGGALRPVPPFIFDGHRLPLRAAPAGDLNPKAVEWPDAARVASDQWPGAARPLADLRILDATSFWAGPCATQLLAYLGADVIHLESILRPDGGRLLLVDGTTEEYWERGPLWLSNNQDKSGLALSLNAPRGRRVLDDLIRRCDVLVENFSPRVFDAFGLTPDAVLSANPKVIYARMPAFGLDGPWRDRVGFAATMEQVAGMAWLTGDPAGPPIVPRGICDPVAGYHAAFGLLAAVWARDRGLPVRFAEFAMVESALNISAESLLGYAVDGVVQVRSGNRCRFRAPQGVYRCRGDEQWIAISVETDEQWVALRALAGAPARLRDTAFDSLEGRLAAHDDIDVEIARWTGGQDLAELTECLVAQGIPAGAVVDPRLVTAHPHATALKYYEPIDHPVVGAMLMPTLPFRFASRPRWSSRPAPRLGQHNAVILQELVGVDDDTYSTLEEAKIIGTRPLHV